jgi:hypothetical protein
VVEHPGELKLASFEAYYRCIVEDTAGLELADARAEAAIEE